MPFFSNSSDIDASHSVFTDVQNAATYNIQGDFFSVHQHRDIASEESAEFVQFERVVPQAVICSKKGYQILSGRLGGEVVVVKVFSGPRAKQHRQDTVSFHRRIMHPHVLHMKATSRPESDTHFVVFDGAYRRSVERQIAIGLRADLTKSILVGMNMVRGLSSGIGYLEDLCMPLMAIGFENYEIFVDGSQNVVISINPRSLNTIDMPREDEKDSDGAWVIFNALCQKTFRAASTVLYGDQVETDRDVEELENTPAPNLLNIISTSTQDTITIPTTQDSTAHLRRELIWRPMRQNDFSLANLSQAFADFLDFVRPGTSRCLLQCRIGSNFAKTVHRCPGYVREEIKLTTSIPSSAVVSHGAPSPHEICTVCGGIVRDTDILRCICGKDDDGMQPTIKCNSCSDWHHRQCVASAQLDPGTFVCSRCTTPGLPTSLPTFDGYDSDDDSADQSVDGETSSHHVMLSAQPTPVCPPEYLPLLEKQFNISPYPSVLQKWRLARASGLTYSQIDVLFRNRRNTASVTGEVLTRHDELGFGDPLLHSSNGGRTVLPPLSPAFPTSGFPVPVAESTLSGSNGGRPVLPPLSSAFPTSRFPVHLPVTVAESTLSGSNGGRPVLPPLSPASPTSRFPVHLPVTVAESTLSGSNGGRPVLPPLSPASPTSRFPVHLPVTVAESTLSGSNGGRPVLPPLSPASPTSRFPVTVAESTLSGSNNVDFYDDDRSPSPRLLSPRRPPRPMTTGQTQTSQIGKYRPQRPMTTS